MILFAARAALHPHSHKSSGSTRLSIVRLRLLGVIFLGAIGGQWAIAVQPVAALTGYGSGTVFGSYGSGDGQFESPAGIAVDNSSGDVFVLDQANELRLSEQESARVERFSAGGAYEAQFSGAQTPAKSFSFPQAIAIDNSGRTAQEDPSVGDVYVTDTGHDVVDRFSSTGEYKGQLTQAEGVPFAGVAGVTVDGAGNVWVLEREARPANTENGHVDEFNDVGTYVGGFDDTYEHAHAIAADSAGDLYVARGPRGEGSVHMWTDVGGVWTETEKAEGSTTIAVDVGNNDLFVDQGTAIVRYGPFGEPFGEPLQTFGSGSLSSSEGLAVDGATHTVYASLREAATVAMFKFGVFPDVSTGGASEIQRAGAKLEGVVNPDGENVTSCRFEYGTTTNYDHTVSCVPSPGSGSKPVAVSAQVSALLGGTTYHYRLTAANADGPNDGADGTFTTLPAVEDVITGAATEVDGHSARLNGSLDPNGFDTRYEFEYGACASPEACEQSAYSDTTASADAGSAAEEDLVSAAVNGLEPNQTYHFHIVANNAFGNTAGGEAQFVTPVLPAEILGAPSAPVVRTQSAVLSASINPEHASTSYYFEYGPCATLAGCATTDRSATEESAQFGALGDTQEVIGLAPLSTYSFRLVAEGTGGRVVGPEGTFTTGSQPMVNAITGLASAITATSATISGTVEPDGQPAAYTFEIGSYQGAATHFGTAFSGSTGINTVSPSLGLSGLQPGLVYAYRITIRSGYGTAIGATQTFATLSLSSPVVQPPLVAQLALPGIHFPVVKKPLAKCKHGYARNKGKCVKIKHSSKGKRRPTARKRTRHVR